MIQNLHINLYAQRKAAGRTCFRQPFLFIACIFFCFICITLFSCRTTDVNKPCIPVPDSALFPYDAAKIEWQPVSAGMDVFVHKDRKNSIMYEIVRIDLTNPALSVFSMKSKPEWQKSTTVKAFAKRTNADVAINTSPFYIKNYILPWSKVRPCGLVVSCGEVLVPPDARYCAIAFYKEECGFSAQIYDSQTEVLLEERIPFEAAGGFWTIFRDGNIRQFNNIKDVRSAAATADDGRTLYLFAGTNLTYGECAVIFQKLGADTAMEFDGGSSVQLVINGKNTIRQSVQRSVCAVIGFFIKKSAE